MSSYSGAEYPTSRACMPTYRYYGGCTYFRIRWRRDWCRQCMGTPAACAVRLGSGEDENRSQRRKAMKKILALSVALALAPAARAADIGAGKARVETVCAACHGANGVSVADHIPNLAGQRAAYIENQLKAFKDGARKAPGPTSPIATMTAIATQ